jgi:hypothetical protein
LILLAGKRPLAVIRLLHAQLFELATSRACHDFSHLGEPVPLAVSTTDTIHQEKRAKRAPVVTHFARMTS